MNPHELHVLVPNADGTVTVASVGELYVRCDEEESMDDVIDNAGIDTLSTVDREAVMRVRRLNETGDADVFWS